MSKPNIIDRKIHDKYHRIKIQSPVNMIFAPKEDITLQEFVKIIELIGFCFQEHIIPIELAKHFKKDKYIK